MIFKCKSFDELTGREVYEILKARCAVFIVEQNCPYQDIDDRDRESLHMFYEDDGNVLGYLRAFIPSPETVQIGRVLTVHHGTGLGGKLLKKGIEVVRERMQPRRILLEAQTYAVGYYAREGFRVTSDEFLEDGIPHVWMTLDCR